jgi:hypothetical protein
MMWPTGDSASDDKTVSMWKRVAQHKWAGVLVLTGNERAVYFVSLGKGKGSLGWLDSAGGDLSVCVWELFVCFFFFFQGEWDSDVITAGARGCSSHGCVASEA